jgi:hypothetical protein
MIGNKSKTKFEHARVLPSLLGYLTFFILLALFIAPTVFAFANPATVLLGEAGNFAVLSKVAISDTVPTATVITGDIGVSPAAATLITGIACSEVVGTIHVVSAGGATLACQTIDPAYLTPTIGSMETAYTDASSRTPGDIVSLSTALDGLNLTPGVYNAANLDLSNNTSVTFDCAGDSSGVFIMQTAGHLDIGTNAHVVLIGGCKSTNIFWAVAGTTTINGGVGTESTFYGTVLGGPATSEIAVVTGSTVIGRLLGQKGIALDQDIITLDQTAPVIFGATTVGFAGANPDTVYGHDQNIRIRLISNELGSGIATLDVNFIDINGTSVWVRATKVDVNNYDINTGHDWNHTFTSVTLKIRVSDNAGNSTASTDLNNQIILNNSITPSGLGGATTNFNDVNNFSAVENLTFEKVGLGKIVFLSDVNLSDPLVIAQLQNLNNAITFSDSNTGNRIIDFNTSGFSGALNGIDVNVTIYGLTFATMPGLLHEGIRCDNNAQECTTSYVGGTFSFTSTLGFSEYEIDGNAPILTNTTTAGAVTATLGVSLNENATCKYTSNVDLNYDTIIDVNATSANTSASWLLSDLNYATIYTENIWCRDLAGNDSNLLVSFTTNAAPLTIVNLGTAGNFVILAKTGISTTGTTSIIGDIGVSPIDSTAITGFGLIMDPSNQFATSSLLTGKIYAADYTVPTPGDLTTAVSNMETAYTDAAGRATPDYTELGAGDISGMTLYPGLYKWGTGVIINNGVTLDCQGDANAVYIFQIGDTLTVGNGAIVTLSNSCLAKNIFWQVAGQTTLGTTTVFNGTILDQVAIVLNNGGTLNGRALSQTAVTLIGNSVNDVNGVVDTTAPIIDLNSTIPSTTIINDTNASIDVNSNERVTCRYNINSDINYALMNTGSTFDSNGIISLVDLIGGTDYNLFVRCRDSAGNDSNGSKLFSFTTVGDTTKPIISLSGLTKTTNSAQVTINTNEGVTCRRSTSDLNYDLMPTDVNLVITTSSGTGSGAISLSGLTASTAYNFYVVCRDSNNNDSNATVSFSTNAQSSGGGSSGGSGLAPCTSYTYSNWNVCDANGIQTRTIVSSVPTWCTGKPILSQTCNVAPIENPTTPVVTPTQPETSTPTTPVVTPTQPETSTPIVPGTGLVTATTPSIDWVMVAIILILIAAIAGAGYVVVRNNQRIEAEKQYVSEKENESARKLKK